MWTLYRQATTWRTRPSDLLAIEDRYVAYCLDEAVAMFGNALTGELESVHEKTAKKSEQKRQRILDKWLGTESNAGQRFKDPARKDL